MAINFNNIGSFNGIEGGSKILNNPTSLQFGPDERLYVAEQNGTINAFTVELQGGEYVATANEVLFSNGAEVVKSIQNHNDDGSPSSQSNRQVTGLVVTGTASHPILYVSSSDPRIATHEDSHLDTNSGVVTKVTWTGTEWSAVDILRGLPRSEENHSVNGMVLGPDDTKLYLTVGGNTNNGAPSQFFAYTGEYALSGTVLEIDLEDLESHPILTDPSGGQNNTSRQYIYDLPTLDDPTVSNVTDGVGEDASGMDEANPWGGNDGFNMAILPADAPLKIFADGLRNQYDIVLTESGKFYTVDNGSNNNIGGNPLDANGNPTELAGAGEATNTPHNGGSGDPEPLFLLSDGGYYGHPSPARSNQSLAWTVYNDDGNPDTSLSPHTVSHLSNLVPDGVNIADGFIIDPSKFTGNTARLSESGIRVNHNSPQSNALVNLGSSSNGLVEYTSNAFDGALQGSLLVTQFNGNVTLLNLSDDGTSIEPLIDPTEGNSVADDDGIFPLITGQSQPLDVTTGPQGTIWVAEFGPDNINVFTPSQSVEPEDLDFDEDGIINVNDPFIRDETNGGSAVLSPGQTLLWDFDANQDDNLPGPNGYGGGLTGVAIDNSTDFEEFFQEPSTLPEQIIKLDNVKFTTAAGGGTTVIESVSNGDPYQTLNNGEYLFHTGMTVAPTVETFNIKWSVFNPADAFTGSFQQIGGYIGTGDQSDYLKIVAIEGLNGEIQVLLEDNDVVQSQSLIQADGLFDVPAGLQIFFDLEIDPSDATATPTVTYEIDENNTTTVSGTAIDLSGTSVLDAILGNSTVNGQTTGLAVGLFSSNNGQPQANTFQAIFNDIEIMASDSSTPGNPSDNGEAILGITLANNDINASNFGNNSFQITNTGHKKIAQVDIDVANALYPDTVFDPFGLAGDTISKNLTINTHGNTGIVSPNNNSFVGTGGTAGFEAIQLFFDENVNGGFDTGETLGFSVDMDPNSIAGAQKAPLDDGSNPPWDVGGVSGAELIGSTFTATFTDGTTAIGQLQGVGNQGGSQSLASQSSPDHSVSLMVNGLEAGDVGTYNANAPNVIVNGSAGQTARVVLTKGFIQPVSLDPFINGTPAQQNFAPTLQAQLDALAASDFPANNAVEFQTVDVQLTGGNQNISELFDFSEVADFDFEGEDQLPLGFVASIIDPTNEDLPLGPVIEPIYLQFDESTDPPPNPNPSESTLYRVNAGGSQIAAIDGGIAWLADTQSSNSSFLTNPGSNSTASFSAVEPGQTVPETTPGAIFDSERWDGSGGSEMQWAFDVPEAGLYEVRLYMGNGFGGTNDPGERIFDVAIEDSVLSNLDDIDLSDQFGHLVGGMIDNTVEVTDGTLNIEFLHEVQNPLVNGIEIIQSES